MSFDTSKFRGAGLFENYVFRSRDAAEKDKPFKARIRRDLVPSELDDLTARPAVLDEAGEEIEPAKTAIADFYEEMAPHVVSWNATAENIETGEIVAIPAPADEGGDMFLLVPPAITQDIYNRLVRGPIKALELNAKN